MSDIITDRSGNMLRIQLNRPRKEKRDDVEHVLEFAGPDQQCGKGRSDTRRSLPWCSLP